MKEKTPFLIEILIGALLLVAGLLLKIDDYYATMLFACGVGLCTASGVQLARLVYWQNPKREAEYSQRRQDQRINMQDERKQQLRALAGQQAYQIMFFVLLGVSFILAVLHVQTWVIALFMLLWLLHWLLGVLLYRRLEKKY